MLLSRRPATGPGHYLRDLVYGALDGCITTFAVVAGSEGASLGAAVAVILGLANLAADGISMGASNYLGIKSDLQQRGESVAAEMPWRHGAATFAAFVVAGAVPLLAFVPFMPGPRLVAAALLAAVVLYAAGSLRSRFIPGAVAWRQGLEMLAVGAFAGAAAYGVGHWVRSLF